MPLISPTCHPAPHIACLSPCPSCRLPITLALTTPTRHPTPHLHAGERSHAAEKIRAAGPCSLAGQLGGADSWYNRRTRSGQHIRAPAEVQGHPEDAGHPGRPVHAVPRPGAVREHRERRPRLGARSRLHRAGIHGHGARSRLQVLFKLNFKKVQKSC